MTDAASGLALARDYELSTAFCRSVSRLTPAARRAVSGGTALDGVLLRAQLPYFKIGIK